MPEQDSPDRENEGVQPEIVPCPKCGSHHVMPEVTVLSVVHGETLQAISVPGALFKKSKGHSPLTAKVCGACGYTEFYATQPEAMWEAWRHHNA